MTSRENETVKRRSLLSFASEEGLEAQPSPVGPASSVRNETNLDHYHRMRNLRLAAESESIQPPLNDIPENLSDEAAEQDAINRMRADMAAIKAELNRRVDAAESEVRLPEATYDDLLPNNKPADVPRVPIPQLPSR